MQSTYAIEGMTCDKCRGSVQVALAPLAEAVTVTRDPGRAVFSGALPVPASAVHAALAPFKKYTASAVSSGTAPVVAATIAGPTPTPSTSSDIQSWLSTYRPLLLIAGYIAVAALAGGGGASGHVWMINFMAGFFLVFSFFKLLDLKGFADSYATYDLLAMRVPAYGLVYPFLELGLGLAYLFRWLPEVTNFATLLLMGFSSLGVIVALRAKRTIRCACLGTVLNLPMSTVTLVEDLAMAGMAAVMLITAATT